MESIGNTSKKGLYLKISILDDKYKEISKKNLIINEDIFLVLKDDNIIKYKSQSLINSTSQEEMLFHVRLTKDNIFKIEKPIRKGNLFQTEPEVKILDNKLWFSLNSKNNLDNNYQNTFPLFENDIIKIGKMEYIVYEVNIISENDNKDKINEDNENIIKNDENEYESINKNTDEIFKRIPEIEYKKCKLCDTNNVCLCKCGEKIHYQCL